MTSLSPDPVEQIRGAGCRIDALVWLAVEATDAPSDGLNYIFGDLDCVGVEALLKALGVDTTGNREQGFSPGSADELLELVLDSGHGLKGFLAQVIYPIWTDFGSDGFPRGFSTTQARKSILWAENLEALATRIETTGAEWLEHDRKKDAEIKALIAKISCPCGAQADRPADGSEPEGWVLVKGGRHPVWYCPDCAEGIER